jgi:hypothetical protein
MASLEDQILEYAGIAERVCAILEQTRESICSCNIVDVPEWFTVCEWHKGITNDSGHAEQLARMICRIGTEIDALRDKNEALRQLIADAAPLAWAVRLDLEADAKAWEKRAAVLLQPNKSISCRS